MVFGLVAHCLRQSLAPTVAVVLNGNVISIHGCTITGIVRRRAVSCQFSEAWCAFRRFRDLPQARKKGEKQNYECRKRRKKHVFSALLS